jgi:hypothetical protein
MKKKKNTSESYGDTKYYALKLYIYITIIKLVDLNRNIEEFFMIFTNEIFSLYILRYISIEFFHRCIPRELQLEIKE